MDKIDKIEEYLQFAIRLGKEAGKIVMDYHKRRLDPIWTSPTHFKTEADNASDKYGRREIATAYPSHSIGSEEGGFKKGKSRLEWWYDAVDGTLGLLTSITDHFSVCVALCKDGVPIVGVINAVKRGELYYAAKGKGAFCNGEPIKVSNLTNINQVVMGVDSGKHNRTAHLPYLEKLFSPGGVNNCLSTGCASVPLCLVASGVMHAYLATSLEPEDQAACVCLGREAGGKVTNLNLEEWKVGDSSILMANPVLHGKLTDFLGLKRR